MRVPHYIQWSETVTLYISAVGKPRLSVYDLRQWQQQANKTQNFVPLLQLFYCSTSSGLNDQCSYLLTMW